MYRMILCAAAALLITTSVQPATADDGSACALATGDEAIAACSRQLTRNPGDANAYENRGLAYNRKAEYDRAIVDFDQAVRLNPKLAVAYTNRGFAYNAKGDYDRAISDCDEAIRLDPKLSAPYNNRAFAYKAKGDYDRAISDYDEAIRRDPKNAVAYDNRGATYNGKGDYDRAIADLNEAIRINPKYAIAYSTRGFAYKAKGDYDRAISDYDQAIRLDPKYAVAYNNRALAYNSKGDYDRAIADCDQAIRLDPKYVFAYNNRGLAYNHKGDYDRAIADFDQAIRLDPKYVFAYNNRGLAFNHKGDYDRAIADLEVAIEINPNYANSYSHRGFAYGQKGDLQRAMADLDKALILNPKYARGYVNRAAIEALRGDRDRAMADFETALKLDPHITVAPDVRKVRAALAAMPDQPAAATSTPTAVPVGVAVSGRRIALVIGMNAYANVAPLPNPVTDARSIAETFRRLGFAEVIEREDLTRASLEEVLKDFGDRAAGADWAVIYYAGHGVEMNGVNYLIPVDAKLARADHIEDETVSLTRVLSKAEPARKLRMVILDACRNNPFRMVSADGRSRAIGRGLSPVEPAGGVLVAYAARHGTTADDGNSGHSPFTLALLANLETPGLDIRIMFSKVRDQVLAHTNNVQEPFTYGSLPGEEFYFRQAGR